MSYVDTFILKKSGVPLTLIIGLTNLKFSCQLSIIESFSLSSFAALIFSHTSSSFDGQFSPQLFRSVSIVNRSLINAPQFLKEGENADILFHAEEEKILACDLPASVVLEITYTEPGIKGDTATNAHKSSTVETGAKVNVPLFINIGDKIKIDTRTGTYSERVKS